MLIFTKNVTILCITLLLSISLTTLAAGQDKTAWLDDNVSARFQEEPMSTVLGKISQQTGIAILYDEKLADQKVTGHYKDIKFSEAINRLFSENNKSIQVFKNEKKIIVKTFGAKQFILASSAKTAPPDPSLGDFGGMTSAELAKMHEQQYKEYKESLSDDNEILEGGMTRKQVTEAAEQQEREYMKRLADENEVLEGGMTRKQVTEAAEQQEREYMKRLADENEVLEGGMTRKQVTEAAEQQEREYMKRLADENEVLEGGMTRKQVTEAAEQQEEKYRERKY